MTKKNIFLKYSRYKKIIIEFNFNKKEKEKKKTFLLISISDI